MYLYIYVSLYISIQVSCKGEEPLAKEWGDVLVDHFPNQERSTIRLNLQVYVYMCIRLGLTRDPPPPVQTSIDPFSPTGQKWISAMRVAIPLPRY